MKRSAKSREAIRHLSRKNPVRIRSAEGHGIGRSVQDVEDAQALARESAARALRIARRG